jgi:hypothetical protein
VVMDFQKKFPDSIASAKVGEYIRMSPLEAD